MKHAGWATHDLGWIFPGILCGKSRRLKCVAAKNRPQDNDHCDEYEKCRCVTIETQYARRLLPSIGRRNMLRRTGWTDVPPSHTGLYAEQICSEERHVACLRRCGCLECVRQNRLLRKTYWVTEDMRGILLMCKRVTMTVKKVRRDDQRDYR